MAATTEAAKMAVEGAATVEAEAVQFASGAEVMSAQTLGLGRSSPQAARPALAARGAPRERHEEEYWVADSGATENMTQDSSNLSDYTPASPGDEVESSGVFFSLLQNMGAYDSWWTKITAL